MTNKKDNKIIEKSTGIGASLGLAGGGVFTVKSGGMGLALMGTAISLSPLIVGVGVGIAVGTCVGIGLKHKDKLTKK